MLDTKQSMIHHWAKCHECGKECAARNAQAWAHNHTRATGHRVEFQVAALVFRCDDSSQRKSA